MCSESWLQSKESCKKRRHFCYQAKGNNYKKCESKRLNSSISSRIYSRWLKTSMENSWAVSKKFPIIQAFRCNRTSKTSNNFFSIKIAKFWPSNSWWIGYPLWQKQSYSMIAKTWARAKLTIHFRWRNSLLQATPCKWMAHLSLTIWDSNSKISLDSASTANKRRYS